MFGILLMVVGWITAWDGSRDRYCGVVWIVIDQQGIGIYWHYGVGWMGEVGIRFVVRDESSAWTCRN